MPLSPNRRVRAAVAIVGAAMALLVAVGGLPTPGSVAAPGTESALLVMSLAAIAGAAALLVVLLTVLVVEGSAVVADRLMRRAEPSRSAATPGAASARR